MEYHLVNMLILLFLLTYKHRANCITEITDDEKAAIENGLAVGSALAEALKEGAFTDALVKLGTSLAPFLGILGPLASILLLFIPGGDSAELIFMREKFEEVNVKLDIITAEFTEVKNAIPWSTVVVSYGTYERKIRAEEENLNRIYGVQRQARENEKENFIIKYESDFDNSVQKLYDIIVNNDHIISNHSGRGTTDQEPQKKDRAVFLGARATSHPRHQGQSLILRYERVAHRSPGNRMGGQNDQFEGHATNHQRRCEKSLFIANEARHKGPSPPLSWPRQQGLGGQAL